MVVPTATRAKDSEIVKAAWDRRLIIVTANGDDFKTEILAFQARTERNNCRELFGLIVLPSGYELQK
jgi:hypothetical protein